MKIRFRSDDGHPLDAEEIAGRERRAPARGPVGIGVVVDRVPAHNEASSAFPATSGRRRRAPVAWTRVSRIPGPEISDVKVYNADCAAMNTVLNQWYM